MNISPRGHGIDSRTDDVILISIHMEKCGGTSFHQLLQRNYGTGFQLFDPGPPEEQRKPQLHPGVRCFHGHMFYGVHTAFPERRFEYITLLRDPVERFLSNLNHIRNHDHPLHDLVTGSKGLHRFCTAPAARHYRNLFVRRLAGVWDEPGEPDLHKAIANLRTFSHVGVLEQVDVFVKQLAAHYTWSDASFPWHNMAPGKRLLLSDLGTEERQLIETANHWDIELMAHVDELLLR